MLGAAGMFAALYSTQAILPDIGEAFHVSPSAAGLTISAVIVALAVGSWLWGPFSDRYGRRQSIVLASALLVLPTIAVALAPSFPVLVVCRALQGLCMPGLLTVGLPYVFETFSDSWGSGRAIGYYMMALIAGGLVGRVGVGIVTSVAGWRWGLGCLAVLPLAAAVVMSRTLPTGPAPTRSAGRLQGVAGQLRNPRLRAPLAVGAALYFDFICVYSYAAFRLHAAPFNYGTAATGLVYLVWVFGVVGPPVGRAIDRTGWRPVALIALALCFASLLISLPEVSLLFVCSLALFAAASFAGFTAAQIGVAESTDTDRGAASAVYFSIYYVFGAAAGYVPGLLWEGSGWTGIALISMGVLVFSAVAVLLADRTRAAAVQQS
jgi:MFS transporter, YNFM family, putative membrane transport protein